MQKKGFVFVETIAVISIILGSLLGMYSLYTSSNIATTKRLRYDDVTKLYETYYIKKYLNSFNLSTLVRNIKAGSKFEVIYRGREDLFGNALSEENAFFEQLWEELNIRSIFLLPSNVTDMIECNTNQAETICANKNLINYLNTLDTEGTSEYRLVIEFAQSTDGSSCATKSDCFYYYASVKVEDIE